jgi:uncharacterized protein DUF4214
MKAMKTILRISAMWGAVLSAAVAQAATITYYHNDLAGSPMYTNRARTNRQFMADLYDVFFRRGADVSGFNYWTGEIDSGARTRQGVINAFFASAEWGARVNELTDAGCVQ